jgi:hypothetical protein
VRFSYFFFPVGFMIFKADVKAKAKAEAKAEAKV